MSDTPIPPTDDDLVGTADDPIQPIQLQDEMENSFLEYAMSVIMSRALPDVRDGLKPVHRRIIWDMEQQGFRPDRPFVKCARVSGDTMANYHPHGDSAIYDALVRMAQPFSLRHPLVDFHGNYGSPDFGPAASRYTECRLHPLAMQLLADIDEDTVDMVPNYDGQTEEPVALPARFPNLLVNGSQGIAVGMATNIPPHNLGEVIDATIHLIDNPDATSDELMQWVKGPDFPTGASILGRAGIIDAYRTGRGSVKMRATATIEEGRNGRYEIVVTALPYQTSCSSIAARIQELVDGGDLDGIADVNDGSAGGKTHLVVSLKRDANANVVMNNLFKLTQLQSSFSINMVALVDGVPRTLGLREALVGYVKHQIEVITRRSNFRLDKARRREHILEGRLKALDVIDQIIALIRASDDAGAAKTALMAEPFEFSEAQAVDILDLQLRQLTRLSRIDLETELTDVRARIEESDGDPRRRQAAAHRDQGRAERDPRGVRDTARVHDQPRRRRDVDRGPRRRQGARRRDDRGPVREVGAGRLVQDPGSWWSWCQRREAEDRRHRAARDLHHRPRAPVVLLQPRPRLPAAGDGHPRARAHRQGHADRQPAADAGRARPSRRSSTPATSPTERYLFFATRKGTVKKTSFDAYDSSRRDGLIAINLNDGDELVRVIETSGEDDIFMVSRKGTTIRFAESDVRPMGRAAAGVRGMKLRAGDEVVSVDVARDDTAILMITEEGYGKRTQLDRFNRQTRGGQGVIGIRLTGKKGEVVAAFMVGLDDEIVAVSSGGVTIRMEVRQISSQGRDATGVRVMNLDDGQTVASVAPILSGDD